MATPPPPDPRTIITPDSFVVAPELLGLPLAAPARRAGAMLVDGFLVALLANAGGVFLAFAAAIALWRASSPVDSGASARPKRRRLLRFAAVAFLFITVFNVADGILDGLSIRADETPAPAVMAEAAEAEAEETRHAARDQEGGGIVRMLRSVADDLGIGFGWGALYFTAFLTLWRGQTPGKRVFGVRVIRLDGRPLSWWIAFERFGGYAASLSTGLLGFLQILWDRNRQALHDKAVETVVIRDLPPSHGGGSGWRPAGR